eukprot:4977775-Prorocentrum_lima.AAC.1
MVDPALDVWTDAPPGGAGGTGGASRVMHGVHSVRLKEPVQWSLQHRVRATMRCERTRSRVAWLHR